MLLIRIIVCCFSFGFGFPVVLRLPGMTGQVERE
jgi:hypothetical protein